MSTYGNHTLLMPKDIGLPLSMLSEDNILEITPELTPFERSLPHAKYYDMMPAPISEEHKAVLAGPPMDPDQAFYPWDYGKYMNTDGHCDVENGYCVLPDGVTYAAALIRQEDRTDEMTDFYNRYFATQASLFYKTWFPGAHYLHYADGALEDFGFGRAKMLFVQQVSHEELGIDSTRISLNDPSCIAIGGTSAIQYEVDSEDPSRPGRNIITMYHRDTDYGRELRIRLWYGIGVEKGTYYTTVTGKEDALNIARCTLHHIIQEYTNDAFLQKRFYEDYYGKPMT